MFAVFTFAGLAVVACGDDGDGETPDEPTAASTYAIEIAAPEDAATVQPVFDLAVDVTGVELALGPNEELVSGAAHWHATSDGVPLPFAYGEPTAPVGPLPAGPHTIEVTLYLNDADTVAVASDAIDVSVAE